MNKEETENMISFLVPIYNEEENIVQLADEIHEALSGKLNYELIFVDDGSTDNTIATIQELKKNKTSPHKNFISSDKLRTKYGNKNWN